MFSTLGEQRTLAQREPERAFPLTLTAATVRAWVAKVREITGQRQFILTMDNGWYKVRGDYQQDRSRFEGNLRGFVDELHDQGLKVLLWFSPFEVDPASEFAEGHPRALSCRDGKSYRDLQHPAARAQLSFVVSRAVSAEPGGYNADGLKVDLGEGETGGAQMARAMQLTYEAAHGAKADALVSSAIADESVSPWMDMVRLFPDGATDPYARATQAQSVSRAMDGLLLDTTCSCLSAAQAREHWMVAVTYGKPGIAHIEWFDSSAAFTPADAGRLAAAWAVYALAPVHPSMRVIVEPQRGLFGRKYAFGQLPGFWAALALSRRCVVTYAHQEARVAATEDHEVVVPLPPRATVKTVTGMLHGGGEQPHRFSPGPEGVLVTVPDAAGPVRYVRITW